MRDCNGATSPCRVTQPRSAHTLSLVAAIMAPVTVCNRPDGLARSMSGAASCHALGMAATSTCRWSLARPTCVPKKTKDVTRGTQATTLQLTPATEGRNQRGKGADRTNSILRKACHAHSRTLRT